MILFYAQYRTDLARGLVGKARSRTILGHGMTIGQAIELERKHLSPLAEEGFPIDELLYPLQVDSKGRVEVKTKLRFVRMRSHLKRN